ncbi:efflux transporter outer membrane subunit [Pandoraea sputorum]|uniref:RND transporter n=1 Tax=Pandoraea sputorum TaxID=93222 RepID=A0A5E5B878_9BURK|nr:efflux transporter outer membrane subunit [Pandoraea sputorum]VVE81387.1 RND transporter [Pandoraea sputorum]
MKLALKWPGALAALPASNGSYEVPSHALRRAVSLGGISLLLATTACTTLGPDYHTPQTDVPAQWHEARDAFDTLSTSDTSRLREWWRSFGDPVLDQLVDTALQNNRDLGIAHAHLVQARAQRIQIASGLGPTISAGGTAQALRSSKRLDWPPGIGQSRTWQLGFDASWELDVFGGTQRAVESADAYVEAVAFDREAVRVSLLAELAADYAMLRTTQARLSIAQENIRTLFEGERLAQRAFAQGLGTSAEVAQARAERELAQAEPPRLQADIEQLSHAIGVLAGGFPAQWRDTLAAPSAVLPVMPALPMSLPSDVIRQRPDVRAAERRLAAATAQIGVAEAERFPHFSIPLSLGTTASLIHDLFSSASVAWSAALIGSQTLYDGGRARASVTVAQAATDAARLAYERDVRLALRDVEDALTGLHGERARQVALHSAVDDSQQALVRTTRLYQRGLSAYLPVLVAQRAANRARDALAISQGGEVLSAIALYKALGAGWAPDTVPVQPASRASL